MKALENICCARIPREAIALLAHLRTEPGVRAALTDRHAWIRWEAGNEAVLKTMLPIHEVVLFGFLAGRWHRLGEVLPAFDFPAGLEYQPLAHVLFPAPVQPLPPGDVTLQTVELALVRDNHPRQTTALLCALAALADWCDSVPTARLAALRGAFLESSILILGDGLPLLDGQRFWGRDLLIPLGFAPSPDLPEQTLKEVVGLDGGDLLLWQPGQPELIPRDRFEPLSRAGVRLARRDPV